MGRKVQSPIFLWQRLKSSLIVAKRFLTSPVSAFSLLCLSICYFVFLQIGIPFTSLEKMFYLISTFIVTQIWGGFFTVWNDLVSSRLKILVFVLIVFLSAFCLVGSRLFLTSNVTILGLLKFFFVAVWICPFISFFLWVLITWACKPVNNNISPNKSWLIFAISFLLVMATGLVYLYVYNPAISSPDTTDQFKQALGLTPISNWHTPFHTLIIRGLLTIGNHPSFVAMAQCAFFAYVIASGTRLLFQSGLSSLGCMVFVLIFILSPNNAVHLITLWKDVPYAASLLWATILFCRVLFLQRKSITGYQYAEIFICLVFVWLLRQNGVVPALCSIVALAIVFRRNWKGLVSIGLSCCACLVFLFPVMDALEVQPGPVGGKYIGLGQDMIGVEVAGGELSPDAQNIVAVLTADEGHQYVASRAPSRAASAAFTLDIPVTIFVTAYLETFFHNPIAMSKAILNRVDLLWNVYAGDGQSVGTVAYTSTEESNPVWLEIAPARRPVNQAVTNRLNSYVKGSVQKPFNNVFWRTGLYTLCICLCAFALWANGRRRVLMALVPCLGQMLSLLLSTGWADYRYYWPIPIISIYFLFLTRLQLFKGTPNE